MICVECVIEKTGTPERDDLSFDNRDWDEESDGYWEKQEDLIIRAFFKVEHNAVIVYEGHSLCINHYAKARLHNQQNSYAESRGETC